MRGQFGHVDLGRVALDDGPNDVGGESGAVDAAALVQISGAGQSRREK